MTDVTIGEIAQRMSDAGGTSCTGGHNRAIDDGRGDKLVSLPCGCTDVHYADGTICFEHAHVECDGKENR